MINLKNILRKPTIIPKGWGREEVICNNSEYCGKRLIFKKGSKLSLHAHCLKRETFYVARGNLILRLIDTEDATKHEARISKGSVVEIDRMLPHQLIAIEDSEVIEFSTHHDDFDSYRYEPGDSQR
jgi:quercetin dioxygenase-like cupin family protein